jgi:hypothetical protein
LLETVIRCAAPSAVFGPCEIELVGFTPTDSVLLGLQQPLALFPCAAFCDANCVLRTPRVELVFCDWQFDVAAAPAGGCRSDPLPEPVADAGQLFVEVGAPTAAEGKIRARASALAERPAPALRRIVPELFCMG